MRSGRTGCLRMERGGMAGTGLACCASLVLLAAKGAAAAEPHAAGASVAKGGGTTLWYSRPAGAWTEALPLGNGRLGAMVFGAAPKERVQLNEESLWAGTPTDPYPPQAVATWREVQRLVLDGEVARARELATAKLTISPTSFRSYEPLGDLWIDLDHSGTVEEYCRDLDLATGIASVSYRSNDIRWTREVLVSAPDDVLAVRLAADRPGALRGSISLTRWKDATIRAEGDDLLRMDGQIVDVPPPAGYDDNPGGSGPGGAHMRFAARLLVVPRGGTVRGARDPEAGSRRGRRAPPGL